MSAAEAGAGPGEGPGAMERLLNWVERVGNKMPHPAILFLGLCVGVILLSQVLFWAGVHATYETVTTPPAAAEQTYYGGSTQPTYVGPTEPESPDAYHVEVRRTEVKGLLNADGVRYLFTSFVGNFRNFAAVAIIMIVMIGVGLAEESGLIGALIRKLVAASSAAMLTWIIVFAGMVSSVASDAGYLVLIPLGAAAFAAVGRHPVAGIGAAFAGVAAGFGVNFLIAPVDAVLTEITNEAAHLVDKSVDLDVAANLYFGIGSSIFVVIVLVLVSTRIVEPRLGPYDPSGAADDVEQETTGPEVSPEQEALGLRYAGWSVLAVVIAVVLLTAIPGAPLRNPETDRVIGDSPFMDSLIVIISAIFFAAGWAYGRGAKTIRNSNEVIAAITKSWAGLAGLLLLFLLIAQFIAYFNYSNMAQVAAVKLGDILEHLDIASVWLLVGVIAVSWIVNFIMPPMIAKWALLAPIFIPLFIRLGIEPQTVLAAFRVGDSPTNVITPLMAYFPLVVVFVQRWQKDAGIGTVISVMLPYVVVLTVAWTLFFVAWYLLGIPLGPGSPV